MNRIQKVSSFFLIIFKILLITLPIWALIEWTFFDPSWNKNSSLILSVLFMGIIDPLRGVPFPDILRHDWDFLTQAIGFGGAILRLLPLLLSLIAIFCGAVIIVISWVMLEASKLHDEQKFTV
jgi:hypothetical protein